MKIIIKIVLCVFISIFHIACVKSENNIKIDATITSSYISINYDVSLLTNSSLTFEFPNTIPGVYSYLDCETKIYELKAYDINGEKCLIKNIEKNIYVIESESYIKDINYKINFNTDFNTENVLSKGILINDSIIIINNNVAFGYFDDYNSLSYQIKFTHNTQLKPFAKSILKNIKDKVDIYVVKDYSELIDNPIIYTTSNIISFNIDSTNFNIFTYSPNNTINSATIKKYAEPVLNVILNKLKSNNIAPENYNLFFYFNNTTISEFNYPLAALEHKNSSVYFFRSAPLFLNHKDSITFVNDIKGTIAHEFLHLFTPISFKEIELDNFNFQKPDSTQFMWLYEGFVEYYSKHLLFEQNILDKDLYLYEQSVKILNRWFYNKNLIEVSNKVYDSNKNLTYFYQKGSLFCMVLDAYIRTTSNNNKNLFTVLTSIFKKNRIFNSELLIKKIISETNDDVGVFINQYLHNNKEMEFDNKLFSLGLKLSYEQKQVEWWYFPIKVINYDINKKQILAYSDKYPQINGECIIAKINNMVATPFLYYNYLKNSNNNKEVNLEIIK